MSRQPKDSDADHANESVYAPQWVGVVCVNPELRARARREGGDLPDIWQALRRHGPEPQPRQADQEAGQ